jgi:hypothetical protein
MFDPWLCFVLAGVDSCRRAFYTQWFRFFLTRTKTMASNRSLQLNRPFIFVSCGQYTEEEKRLGQQIAQMAKDALPGFDAFFAQNVQDLNGLDANILSALHECAGLIVVLHPRGTIERPNDSLVVRASVWVEQEIAIATYIQRVEKRSLPIIAFKHVTVDREGLRELLHMNPIEFTDESEVLALLPERLRNWRNLPRSDQDSESKRDRGSAKRELRQVTARPNIQIVRATKIWVHFGLEGGLFRSPEHIREFEAVVLEVTNDARMGVQNVGGHVQAAVIYEEPPLHAVGAWLEHKTDFVEMRVNYLRSVVVGAQMGDRFVVPAVRRVRDMMGDSYVLDTFPLDFERARVTVQLTDASDGHLFCEKRFQVTQEPLGISPLD